MDQVYPYVGESIFYNKIKGTLFIVSAILIVLSFFGETSLLVLPSVILLIFLFKWFATDHYPPVILVGLLFQWLQVSIKVIYSTITQQSLESLAEFPEHIIDAYLLSCIALFVLGFGIKIIVKKLSVNQIEINNYLTAVDSRKALVGYLAFSIFSALLFKLRFTIPGLFQGIVALGYIKWTLFFLIFYVSFVQKKNLNILKGVIILEFIMGFAAYFSDFTGVLFYSLICFLAVGTFSKKHIPKLILAVVFMISIGLVWTAVKMDYREYLNQGAGQQVVSVSTSDALSYLIESLENLDREQLELAERDLINRISYIDYFSSCMSYVPSELDHEGGLLTKNAIMHILVPRMFNPNKPAIDDSKHLTKYTGVFYADAKMGVSFSLGYVPDFYVDFGAVYMFIPIFLLGCLIGLILISIHKTSPNSLWALAIMLPVFTLLFKFETALIKYFGNLIMFWLVALLFNKFVVKHINKYIIQ